MKQHWHDLIQDYLAGNTDPEQTAELEAALRDDPQLRELYLKYAALDVALETSGDVRGNLREMAIAHAGRRFPVETDSHRWRTGSIKMELPPGTHMLMVDITAHNLPDPYVGKAHFIDDVQATLIVPTN